ncbi:50S ribosomal protein L32 [Anaplasmataceae bacterium AB001_6]|nr:50S ribosomal protein L32 [Anaplasmataceae bacterium AB001_6]
MAVPKRKRSVEKRGKHRSHQHLEVGRLSFCAKSGEYFRPHHATSNGFYKDKKIVNNIAPKKDVIV